MMKARRFVVIKGVEVGACIGTGIGALLLFAIATFALICRHQDSLLSFCGNVVMMLIGVLAAGSMISVSGKLYHNMPNLCDMQSACNIAVADMLRVYVTTVLMALLVTVLLAAVALAWTFSYGLQFVVWTLIAALLYSVWCVLLQKRLSRIERKA